MGSPPAPQQGQRGIFLELAGFLDIALHGTVVAPAALALDVALIGNKGTAN